MTPIVLVIVSYLKEFPPLLVPIRDKELLRYSEPTEAKTIVCSSLAREKMVGSHRSNDLITFIILIGR